MSRNAAATATPDPTPQHPRPRPVSSASYADSGAPPDDALYAPHERDWQSFFGRRGFVRTPHSFFSKCGRSLSDIERGVLGIVLQRTVGAPITQQQRTRGVRAPEWLAVTERDLARYVDASVNGVSNALDRLTEIGAVERRKVGRSNEYRVVMDRWDNLPTRPRQTPEPIAADEDSGEETSAVAPADRSAGQRIAPRRSATITLDAPIDRFRLVNHTTAAFNLAVTTTGIVTSIVVSDADGEEKANADSADGRLPAAGPAGWPAPPICDTTSGLVVSRSSACGLSITCETSNQVSSPRVSPAATNDATLAGAASDGEGNEGASMCCGATLRSFSSLLIECVGARVGSAPPESLLSSQFARLADAGVTLEQFGHRLRQRSRVFRAWPFLRSIVDDVIGLAAAHAAATTPVRPAVDAASVRLPMLTRADIARGVRSRAAERGIEVQGVPDGSLDIAIDATIEARLDSSAITEKVNALRAEYASRAIRRNAAQLREDAIAALVDRQRTAWSLPRVE